MISLPSRPSIWSIPTPPIIISRLLPPTIVSSPATPASTFASTTYVRLPFNLSSSMRATPVSPKMIFKPLAAPLMISLPEPPQIMTAWSFCISSPDRSIISSPSPPMISISKSALPVKIILSFPRPASMMSLLSSDLTDSDLFPLAHFTVLPCTSRTIVSSPSLSVGFVLSVEILSPAFGPTFPTRLPSSFLETITGIAECL